MNNDNKSAVLLCTCGKQLQLSFDSLQSEIDKIDSAALTTVHDQVCQEEGLTKIAELLKANGGRLVIAACTSQKIQPRISRYLKEHGIDESQIQYVNIREHSAWVHRDVTKASKKSLDMIRGALARSKTSVPLPLETKEVSRHVTVIGGGIAGIESALSLSNLGYEVALLESSDRLGGHLLHLPMVAPSGKSGMEVLSGRLEAIESDTSITVMTKTSVKYVTGEMGDFTVKYVTDGDDEQSISTSAVVLAMGFKEFEPIGMDEYRYGKNPDVITQFQLSCMLSEGVLGRPSDNSPIKEVVMVQCVGSRSEDHKRDCSKLCCTFAIEQFLGTHETDT